MANDWNANDAQNLPPDPDTSSETMVGLGRVEARGFSGMAMPAPGLAAQGATMVGLPRIGVPAPASAPAATLVGLPRVGAPMTQAPAATMVGMPLVAGRMMQPSEPAMEPGATLDAFPSLAPGFGAEPTLEGPPSEYELLALLGTGELGQVFHARHSQSGSEVALRVVAPEILAVPGAVEALRDVVALAQSALHAHLGRQLALDEAASPTLVLEYVPGKALNTLMQERGVAPASAVIDLGVRLCSALAAAHAAGLAHGRVHAGNVVLERGTGRWVLLDLGHGYALQGLEPAHDLYALGALLYELATGHSPFEVSQEAPMDPRSYVPRLPATLSAVLMRTLSPDPAMWFPSATELAQALARTRNAS